MVVLQSLQIDKLIEVDQQELYGGNILKGSKTAFVGVTVIGVGKLAHNIKRISFFTVC